MTVSESEALRRLLNAPTYRNTCPPDKDAYTWAAAQMFDVDYADVTPQQRAVAKHACFGATA